MRGQKPFDITSVSEEKLFELGKSFPHDYQIYQYLGISHNTFYRHIASKNELRAAIDRGRVDGVQRALGKLEGLVDQGNLGAIAYYLDKVGHYDKPRLRIDLTEFDLNKNEDIAILSNLITQKVAAGEVDAELAERLTNIVKKFVDIKTGTLLEQRITELEKAQATKNV
jgi:AcrR family transcriptional regulator